MEWPEDSSNSDEEVPSPKKKVRPRRDQQQQARGDSGGSGGEGRERTNLFENLPETAEVTAANKGVREAYRKQYKRYLSVCREHERLTRLADKWDTKQLKWESDNSDAYAWLWSRSGTQARSIIRPLEQNDFLACIRALKQTDVAPNMAKTLVKIR